ncbi:hypothetical protein pb186bvf_017111 [Paramecium bursaria]
MNLLQRSRSLIGYLFLKNKECPFDSLICLDFKQQIQVFETYNGL